MNEKRIVHEASNINYYLGSIRTACDRIIESDGKIVQFEYLEEKVAKLNTAYKVIKKIFKKK